MINRWGPGAAILWAALLALGLSAPTAGEPLSVRFLIQESQDQRFDYPAEVLNLALEKSGVLYELEPTTRRIRQQRAVLEVAHDGDINVMWTMTSIAREAILHPIRIPVYRGLIGLRLPLVMAENEHLLGAVSGLEQLGEFRAGQGSGWPDTEILEANGLPVVAGPAYQQLFPMLQAGRFDYFPRSVLEIWAEAETYSDDGIIVSPHLALRYPAAVYFFVARDNDALAEAIEQGLERALADGSFEALFEDWYGDAIARARLDSRVILELGNPLLPEQTPLEREELWFTP